MKKGKKKCFLGWKNFFFQKNHFFRAKNATVTPWRSGTDFCWLFCGLKFDENSTITAHIYFEPIVLRRHDVEVEEPSQAASFCRSNGVMSSIEPVENRTVHLCSKTYKNDPEIDYLEVALRCFLALKVC